MNDNQEQNEEFFKVYIRDYTDVCSYTAITRPSSIFKYIKTDIAPNGIIYAFWADTHHTSCIDPTSKPIMNQKLGPKKL